MRLGILGSGQLATMLAQAARKRGIVVIIYTSDQQGPAHAHASCVIEGDLHDHRRLREFFSAADIITFENEFIDINAITRAQISMSTTMMPRADLIYRLSDKIEQKMILQELAIATPTTTALPPNIDENILSDVIDKFHHHCVLKWNRYGYDGKGVFLIDKSSSLSDAQLFCQRGVDFGATLFVEERVNFVRELAMVAVRSRSGEFAHYPLVVSEQARGVCKEIIGPAISYRVLKTQEIRVAEWMKRFAHHLDFVGAFAFELFEEADGRLLVNEIAPRVHNSAHYTLDACVVNQFDNHLRAILGESPDTTVKAPYFAMRNLLGPDHVAQNVTIPTCMLHPSIALHWYNKHETRPQRKLGHLNACAHDEAAIESARGHMSDFESRWIKTFA